ncbi:hypothetical protein N8J89_03750 [Crossiella sp. CA-258035]|uniref:hypothetical protein n=1 Tax=Crossiella sp. CA-258035 TaxID=2981138 RepID=UPI0024BCED7F|nr:hypothetical protein [Crossiella sp. CA-258035]WHT20198.1 hypothetical protein N8J89_03750 [Crossiella sp. CA-258035]
MGFDDEVSHNRSSKASEERAQAEQRAASGRRSAEEYEIALQAALDYLSRHLHPTKLLLEKRMIRADVYTPNGYVLYRHRGSGGFPGIKSPPSATPNTLVDMLTTDGRVWSHTSYRPGQFLSQGEVLSSGFVFGLSLDVEPDGQLTARRSDSEDRWIPFRDHLVSLRAAAHETHAARL